MKLNRFVLTTAVLATLVARPASATFHEMQIEQVIAGVNGSTNAQAIQLRMRAPGQNLMSNGRLNVRDATGANPVLLIAFPTNVTGAATGARVLAVTSDFANAMAPALIPDFILTNPIPPSYLAAGTLTYEDNFGTILWRLSWGGANYTGPGTGDFTNDLDFIFNPPIADPLPSTTTQALLFKFAATARSTNNANDYALTPGAATFTNNAGVSATINNLAFVGDGAPSGVLALAPPAPNPARNSISYSLELPRDERVRVRVLDVAGRVVSTLADESMSSGRHPLTWNASSHAGPAVSDGVYFLEMSAGGETRVRRFVLIQ